MKLSYSTSIITTQIIARLQKAKTNIGDLFLVSKDLVEYCNGEK